MSETTWVELFWKDRDEAKSFEDHDDVREAGEFLERLEHSYDTEGIRLEGEVEEVYVEEDTAYLDAGDYVKASPVVYVESHEPQITERAAIGAHTSYRPTEVHTPRELRHEQLHA